MDTWIDHSKTKTGYETNSTKYFCKYKPLISIEEIRRDILALKEETMDSLKEILLNPYWDSRLFFEELYYSDRKGHLIVNVVVQLEMEFDIITI